MIQSRIQPALCVALLGVALSIPHLGFGQIDATSGNSVLLVDESVNEVKLIAGTSRVLEFKFQVPQLIVENEDVLQATPITANQILITGKKLGFTSLTVHDRYQNPTTLRIQIVGDVRGLEAQITSLYPDARVRATALPTKVVLQGTVGSANQIPAILATAKDFFPEVQNNLTIAESQLVAIEVKVYEVSRTKLRQAGIDWSLATSNVSLASQAGLAGAGNLQFSVIDGGTQLSTFLDVLERNTLAKLMDSPTLVAMNGRPAEFLEGGEVPFQVNQGLGQTSIQFRPFGTKLDVVPFVLGHNRVRLEIRAEVSEPDATLASDDGTLGFRVRRVNTGVEMKVGHTLALAGDIREETEAVVSGFPVLKDAPYIGALFRRVEETHSEIELIITMTPRLVAETDPANMPPVGPGQLTRSPSNCELYWKGHIEVPKCEDDCPIPNGLAPAQPLQYENGNAFGARNEYLDRRPTELPPVVQEYQQYYPSTSSQYEAFGPGQELAPNTAYPNATQAPAGQTQRPIQTGPTQTGQPAGNNSASSSFGYPSNSAGRPQGRSAPDHFGDQFGDQFGDHYRGPQPETRGNTSSSRRKNLFQLLPIKRSASNSRWLGWPTQKAAPDVRQADRPATTTAPNRRSYQR